MPTTRPRHVITETDDVARALDEAALRWPEHASDRTALVRRLLAEGQRSLQEDRLSALLRRRAAIEESAGAFSGCYGPNHLAELREDWPA